MNNWPVISQAINTMAHEVVKIVTRCEDASETLHLGNYMASNG